MSCFFEREREREREGPETELMKNWEKNNIYQLILSQHSFIRNKICFLAQYCQYLNRFGRTSQFVFLL
jgi:hypothetical protein